MHDNDEKPARARTVEVSEGEDGQRVDNFLLSRAPGVPRSHVYRQIRTGQVRVNGGRIKPTRKLVIGDQVRIPPTRTTPAKLPKVPDKLTGLLKGLIVHETDDFLVLNKPEGLAVHAGSGLAFGAIDALRQALDAPKLELVHRLDRGTSGALLVARDRGKCRALQALFREQRVEKHYLALLDGVWVGDTLKTVSAPLLKNKAHAGERRVIISPEGQAAISHFSLLEQLPDAALVRVQLETGRTHQIRVHAAHLGHPVVGDTRYGQNDHNQQFKRRGLRRMFLHSERLSFEFLGERTSVQAPLDAVWQSGLAELGNGNLQ